MVVGKRWFPRVQRLAVNISEGIVIDPLQERAGGAARDRWQDDDFHSHTFQQTAFVLVDSV
jgi:hypothetical protein